MRKCPSCSENMNLIQAGPLELDACAKCGGFWFDGGELEQVTGLEAAANLGEKARRGTVRCKGCSEPFDTGLRECVTCGRPPPKCPECGDFLRVGNIRGVNLDICARCSGAFLDTGELQLLAKDMSFAAQVQQAAFSSKAGARAPARRIVCKSCSRQLRRAHAFVADEEPYCGTCAPSGATPMVAEPSMKVSSLEMGGHYVRGVGTHGHSRYRSNHIEYGDDNPLEGAVTKFFSWLFSSK